MKFPAENLAAALPTPAAISAFQIACQSSNYNTAARQREIVAEICILALENPDMPAAEIYRRANNKIFAAEFPRVLGYDDTGRRAAPLYETTFDGEIVDVCDPESEIIAAQAMKQFDPDDIDEMSAILDDETAAKSADFSIGGYYCERAARYKKAAALAEIRAKAERLEKRMRAGIPRPKNMPSPAANIALLEQLDLFAA